MKTYRSRNKLSYSTYSLDTKNSLTSRILKLEEEKVKKHKILTNLVESAGEARAFIHKNNILRQNISHFKQNNLHIKNIIDKIILYIISYKTGLVLSKLTDFIPSIHS